MRYLTAPLFALGLLAVGLTPSADAGDCASGVCHVPVKQAVVVQQQAVVATPVVLTQFVPVAVPVFAVGYDPTALGVVEELRAIREELRQAKEALTLPRPPVLPQQQGIEIVPDPMGKLPPTPGWQGVLQKHCAGCHTGEKAKAGLQIFTAPGVLGDTNPARRFDLWDIVAQGKMPPAPRPKPDAAEIAVLRQWAREAVAKGK